MFCLYPTQTHVFSSREGHFLFRVGVQVGTAKEGRYETTKGEGKESRSGPPPVFIYTFYLIAPRTFDEPIQEPKDPSIRTVLDGLLPQSTEAFKD